MTKSNLLELFVRPVKIVVHNDQIVCSLLREVDFVEGGCQTLRYRCLGLCPTTLEALAERGERGRRNEEVDGVQIRRFNLADSLGRVFGRTGKSDGSCKETHLRLDIQQTPPARVLNFPNGHEAGTIEVSGKLSVLDECALGKELLKLVVGDEVVVFAVDLAGARGTRGVWAVRRRQRARVSGRWNERGGPRQVLTGDTESKFIRVIGKKAFEESALANAGRARHDERAEKVCDKRHCGCLRRNKGRGGTVAATGRRGRASVLWRR